MCRFAAPARVQTRSRYQARSTFPTRTKNVGGKALKRTTAVADHSVCCTFASCGGLWKTAQILSQIRPALRFI
jgi:hypothetical protein